MRAYEHYGNDCIPLKGGTVDISAHEVRKGGTLAALAPPSGGAWGGTIVDKKLNKFLEELLGRDVLDEFSVECKDDKLDMERMLELKKRTLKRSMGEDDDEVHMKLPAQLFEVYKVKHPDKTFHTSVQMGKFKETVRQKRDRLHITKQLLINMFDESRDSVIQHLHMLLGQRELRDIKIIMLVGGFSESEIIQTAIKDAFPLHDVIAPEDGGTAIIKGIHRRRASSYLSNVLMPVNGFLVLSGEFFRIRVVLLVMCLNFVCFTGMGLATNVLCSALGLYSVLGFNVLVHFC